MLEVREVSHAFGHRVALDDVTFDVAQGEMFGLLGPNGGGKTTLLAILSTLIDPDAGSARVAGADVVEDAPLVRSRIGVVFQQPGLDPCLTGRENLRHQGHLYGLRGRELAARIEEVLRRLSVLDRADERVKELSGGLRRRIEVAKGLVHRPRLLLLDEPTAGFDPTGRRELWNHLARLRGEEGVTVVVATHLMDEAEACDRVAIFDEGRIVALGTPDELKASIHGDIVSLEADDPAGLAAEIPARLGAEAILVDGRVRIEQSDGAAFVPRLATAFPDRIRSITVGRPTLADVFVRRTGRRFEEARANGGAPTVRADER